MKKDNGFLYGVMTGVLGSLFSLILIFAIIKFSCGGVYFITGDQAQAFGEDGQKNIGKISQIHTYIEDYFMEEVEDEALVDGMCYGMMATLEDPYSTYYSNEQYTELLQDTSGSYCGIGALVAQSSETGKIYIVESYEGGAAYEAGLVYGDEIRKVQGKSIEGKELNDVIETMKGEEGTTVDIEFYIAKEDACKTITMERRQVEVPSVKYEMLKDNIGYIIVSGFKDPTDEQFQVAIKELQEKGMEGLVIDLRNNGGGILDSTVNMLDTLLPKDSLIVSTKDKNGEGTVYKAKDKEEFKIPLVVLINENSASASEVFAGAVQDYKLGEIVGTTSFGKGIVQSLIGLPDGSAIKLTTSKYYTPNGRNIHGTGIEPDIVVELKEELKEKGIYTKEEDNQLQKAIVVLKNKM